MTTIPDLLPCPFCGGDAMLYYSNRFVCCADEECAGWKVQATADHWNCRATHPALLDTERVREAVERISEQAEHVSLGIACKSDISHAHLVLLEQINELRAAPLDAERVREDERDRLYEIAALSDHPGEVAWNVGLFLQSLGGAMLPAERAALRQKEGKA